MPSLKSEHLMAVLKGGLGINRVRGERAPQVGHQGTEPLWTPGLCELHGAAGHTKQETSGREAGNVGWGWTGCFSGRIEKPS